MTAALLVAALAMAAWWRGRPSRGTSRGLPPGSLGVRTSLRAITERGFLARQAARHGPIFKMAQFHRPTVVVTDLALGLDVLDRERDRLIPPRQPLGRRSPTDFIAFLTDASHPRHRPVLRTVLGHGPPGALREGIDGLLRERLAALARDDHAAGVSPDAALADIAFASIAHAILGIAGNDPSLTRLQQQVSRLATPRILWPPRPEDRGAAFTVLVDRVRTQGVALRERQARGEAVTPSVLAQVVQADPQQVTDDVLLGNLVLLVLVTRSNVEGVLRWTFKELLDQPASVTALREAGADVDALAGQFVYEVLRLHQSEYFYREVRDELRIGRYRIPRGWLVRVGVREAHDDPEAFPDPGRFDPSRFAHGVPGPTVYCPFSDGSHSPFGAALSLTVAGSLVRVMALEFDGRVVADGPVVRSGNRHWSHWRPNPRLRVALPARTPRSAPG